MSCKTRGFKRFLFKMTEGFECFLCYTNSRIKIALTDKLRVRIGPLINKSKCAVGLLENKCSMLFAYELLRVSMVSFLLANFDPTKFYKGPTTKLITSFSHESPRVTYPNAKCTGHFHVPR